MAMACIYGGRECNGCMHCKEEPEVIGYCCVCDDPVYKSDMHYTPHSDLVCCSCASDYMEQFKVEGKRW